jgi:GNAT superfamily N-acetyltransferase
MHIEITETPDDADYDALYRALDAFNDETSFLPEPARKLALLIRGEDGAAVGGLWAVSYYSWMFVQILYLPAHLRHGGTGSRLLAMAEAEAVRRGCRGIWLDTFSFQARPFYERHGYTVFGRIDDYPVGRQRFFLSKRLDSVASSAEKAPAAARDPGP